MTQRVLVVAARPGDESSATGATIAHLRAIGSAVSIVTVVHDPDSADALGAAVRALDVTDHRYLGSRTARWEGLDVRRYTETGPGSVSEADLGEIASDIGAVIMSVRPDVVVGAAGPVADADRARVHEATAWAAEALRTPLYVPDSRPARGRVHVDDPTALARKRSAVGEYRGRLAVVDPGAAETLGRHVSVPPPAFARFGIGARILAGLFALVLGAVAGTVLTAAHQASVVVGETAVPWGLIAALVLTAALLAGLRVVYETRFVAGCATAGLLAAIGLLSLGTASGSVLVPDNESGLTWTIGAVLIAAVVLAWPRFDRSGGGRMKARSAKGSDHP